jgi:hypothetical protein
MYTDWANKMRNCIGERKLLCAIIEQACKDATGQRKHQEASMADAKKWLNSEENHPFSYIWICGQLQLAPSIVRHGVKSMRENKARWSKRGWIMRVLAQEKLSFPLLVSSHLSTAEQPEQSTLADNASGVLLQHRNEKEPLSQARLSHYFCCQRS